MRDGAFRFRCVGCFLDIFARRGALFGGRHYGNL
jgi:hypothetical protein